MPRHSKSRSAHAANLRCGLRCRPRYDAGPYRYDVPVRSMDVRSVVVDFLMEVTMTQVFHNSSGQTVDAKYVLPMDSGAAVNGFLITVDGRTIKGVCQEKQDARLVYETAKKLGHGAFLLEESDESADVFTADIGNLLKDATVEVTVSYVTEVPMEGHDLRVTIPNSVAPRYDRVLQPRGHGPRRTTGRHGHGRGKPRGKRVPPPDQGQPAVPAVAEGGAAGGAGGAGAGETVVMSHATIPLKVSLSVSLPSRVTQIKSPSHADAIVATLGVNGKPTDASVDFRNDAEVKLGADFVVVVSQAEPNRAHAFVETLASPAAAAVDGKGAAVDGKGAAVDGKGATSPSSAVMVAMYPDLHPADDDDDAEQQLCEVVFVVDRSGSMGGSRMTAAKSALQLCLRSLPEGCTFQIVSFGSRFTKLFPTSKPYNRTTLQAAATHVDGMKANYGGTDIWAPLQDVFSDAADPAMPRQVLLFTDGEVKNTRSVVDLVRREASKSGVRCFAFGIGNDVSHALVDGVASSSGGTAEYIHSGERMDTKVARQLERAMDPALVNAHVDWGDLTPFMEGGTTPSSALPVHHGRRVSFFCRLRGDWPAATVALRGDLPSGPVSWSLRVAPRGATGEGGEVHEATEDGGQVSHVVGRSVHTALARSRVRDLEQLSTAAAKVAGVRIAKEFNVASKWTSLVAVELREKAGPAAAATLVVGGSQPPKAAAAEDAAQGGHRTRQTRRRDRSHAHAHAHNHNHNHTRGGGGRGGRRRGAQYAVVKGAPAKSTSAPRAAAGRGFVGDPFAGLDGPAYGGAAATTSIARSVPSGARRRSTKKEKAKNAAPGFAAPPPPPGPMALSRQSSAERAAVSPCIFNDAEDDAMHGAMDMLAAVSFAPPAAPAAPSAASKSFFARRKPAPAPAPMASHSAQQAPRRASRAKEGEVDTRAAAIPTDLFFAAAEEESKTVSDAARPAQGSMDVFAAIVSAQQANGTWTPSSALSLAASLGVSSAVRDTSAAPPALPADVARLVWATAVMVQVLATFFAANKVEWRMMAKKARQWLARTCAASGVDSKAVLSAAAAAVA